MKKIKLMPTIVFMILLLASINASAAYFPSTGYAELPSEITEQGFYKETPFVIMDEADEDMGEDTPGPLEGEEEDMGDDTPVPLEVPITNIYSLFGFGLIYGIFKYRKYKKRK